MKSFDPVEGGICLVCLSDNPDHQEVIYSLHAELRNMGCNVHTIGIENPKTQHRGSLESNHYVRCPKRPGLTLQAFRIPDLIRIVRLIKSLHVAYVYFETVHIWNAFIERAIKRNSRVLQVIHDVTPHDGSKAVLLANKICAQSADYVIIRNERDFERCSTQYGISLQRIRFLDSWRSFSGYTAIRHTHTFLFFGRLRKYKGLEALLDIAKLLPDVQFKVLGESDNESLPVVNDLAKLPNVCVNEGFVSAYDMENAFLDSDWVLVPYESASQSGIIMDSYRYSRPVIAYNVGAISEQVIDGSTGFLVACGDLQKYTRAIQLANEMSCEELVALSRNAYAFGLDKYSAQSAARKIAALIKSVNED